MKNFITSSVIKMIERGWLDDRLTRAGIRYLCRKRIENVSAGDYEQQFQELIAAADNSPIAPLSEKANEQHYEIPAAFYDLVLGPHKKYSCCLFEDLADASDLGQAEANALRVTCERAGIQDGMDILELGCGWGSLTLWMAEHFPNSRITAVSNSQSQREHIMAKARDRGIDGNLELVTADMNDFEPAGEFDRVVSVEMFEHMRNHRKLLQRISTWLKPAGKLFVHIFCHRDFAYSFETEGVSNWMGRYFFTGGIMPSESLFGHYCHDMQIVEMWRWNGRHYEETSNRWLESMDRNREAVLEVLSSVYGADQSIIWFNRWRVFFMACAELFGAQLGKDWYVAHFLFEHACDDAAHDRAADSLHLV